MSSRLEALASEREHLLARSSLCRLRLHRQAHGMRDSLHWKRAAIAIGLAPATRRIAFGVALSLIGFARTRRMVLLAGRVVIYAKLASSIIGGVRTLAAISSSDRARAGRIPS